MSMLFVSEVQILTVGCTLTCNSYLNISILLKQKIIDYYVLKLKPGCVIECLFLLGDVFNSVVHASRF